MRAADAQSRMRGAERDPVVRRRFCGSVGHGSNVSDAHRHAIDDVDREIAERRDVADARVGFDDQLRVCALQLTTGEAHVRDRQREQHVADRRVARRHGGRVDVDAQLARAPADHFDAIGIGHGLQIEREFLRESSQIVIVDVRAIAPERRDDDGHVVDLDGLYDPRGQSGRHQVLIRQQLVVELDERVFAVLPDEEPHGDDRATVVRHRVDVFDAVDLRQQFFERRRHETLDLACIERRRFDQHVGERHDDLRFFLARRVDQREYAGGQRDEHQHDRQRAVQRGSNRTFEHRIP